MLGIIPELLIRGFILLSTNFSRTFEKNGKRLIGLYDEGNSGGLPGFGINIIIEVDMFFLHNHTNINFKAFGDISIQLNY